MDEPTDAVTNGAMKDGDKDMSIQVLCNKKVITAADPGQPNDTCNKANSKPKEAGFL